jgi:hypothetical protein
LTRMRVLHREMELINQRVEKIERSAEALWMCHHPILFPSSKQFCG